MNLKYFSIYNKINRKRIRKNKMVRILSWDIGIKNLAYCVINENENNEISILDWNVFNISADTTCDYVCKIPCTKSATYHSNVSNLYFCTTHIKKYQKENPEEKFKKIIQGKDQFFQTNCNIPQVLDQHKELFLSCQHIVLENQPIFKNPKMKTIQMILYSYFILRGITDKHIHNSLVENIQCFSATNKLKLNLSKDYNNHAETETETVQVQPQISTKDYKDRKKLSIDLVYQLVKDTPNLYTQFHSHKKKDDLADCLLQAITYRKFFLNCQNPFTMIDRQ
jgi:hypothetical protein